MRVTIEGQTLVLKPAEIIGQGGEAVVYRRGARAIKIYEGLSSDALAQKAAKLAAFPRALPDAVLAPLALAHDDKGALVGYAMRFLDGALDGQKLTTKKSREGVVGAGAATAWLEALAELLAELHARGVVVGDLNDGNVLWGLGRPYLIDTDSYQFGGHACTVAHEKYLDPRYYGVDLAKDAVLDRSTDWYAFAVLAFSVLLLVHPYGGTHPRLGTLTRRAEARVSALSSEVTRPKVALPPEVLPDPLLEWFRRTFEGGLRERLPAALLALRWTTCACGLEHARAVCPACAASGVVRARPVALRHGRVEWVPQARVAQGRLRAAVMQGGLRALWEADDGRWLREDGRTVTHPLGAPTRVAFGGGLTWLARGATLVAVDGERVVERRTVGTLGGEAAFDANGRGVYYLEGDYLVDGATGARVGSILEGATHVRVGSALGYGYYRAGQLTHHFAFRVGKAGLVPLDLPPIRGRLLAHAVYFDEAQLLVAWREEAQGREHAQVHLVSASGQRLASAAGDPATSPLLTSPGGFALARGRVLRATDAGVLSVEAERGALVPGALFVDAEPFVAEGSEILPGPGGSLYVLSAGELGQLCLV